VSFSTPDITGMRIGILSFCSFAILISFIFE
jgi:hypothetical protein